MSSTHATEFKPLDHKQLAQMQKNFDARAENRLAMNAVTTSGINKVAHNYDLSRRLPRRFSISLDNGKATEQKRSGRCWLFSSLNVARYVAKKNMHIKEFEFSQAYAMYFDKLERVNYFVQDTADLIAKGESSDGRLMNYLLTNLLGDGGQWTMAMNIYKKYGAVPKDIFPETATSMSTAELNTQLRRLLRKAVCRMYQAQGNTSKIAAIQSETVEMAQRILTIHLGTPPQSFEWEWRDENDNFHRDGVITPQEFWKKYVNADLEDYVCLVDDPRPEHPKGQKIAIEHLGNVVGGDPTEYLNVDVQTMKEHARHLLEKVGIPVWFGADCHPFMDREKGQWAINLFEYDRVYGSDLRMTKEEGVRFADTAMNHAMAFVGVDVSEEGHIHRWNVENSWGTEIADKGYFTMEDKWFDEYVFEIALPRTLLSKELQEALKKPAISLPAWDPMGALA